MDKIRMLPYNIQKKLDDFLDEFEEDYKYRYKLQNENHIYLDRMERVIRKLEDLIIVGEQVENEWAVDICKMVINELRGEK